MPLGRCATCHRLTWTASEVGLRCGRVKNYHDDPCAGAMLAVEPEAADVPREALPTLRPSFDTSTVLGETVEEVAYAEWRAAVLDHERMCREVDLWTPADVYAAYLAARTREIEAALALRKAVAPLGLGVASVRPSGGGRIVS